MCHLGFDVLVCLVVCVCFFLSVCVSVVFISLHRDKVQLFGSLNMLCLVGFVILTYFS